MNKYCIFFYLCLYLIFSCKSTVEYSSIFNYKNKKNQVIIKEINNNRNYVEEITLNNGFKVILNQNNSKKIDFSIYLKNPPLYQTNINSGVELIILLYLEDLITGKIKQNSSISDKVESSVFGNDDISRLSFSIENKKDFEIFLDILGSSLRIDNFNQEKIETIRKKVLKNYYSYVSSNKVDFHRLLERYVFRTSKLYNSFYGSLLSLKLISVSDIEKYYNNSFFSERFLLFINGNISKKDFKIEYFEYFENYFNNVEGKNTIQYERISNKDFIKDPAFFEINSKEISTFQFLFRAPSFLNDEYFSFLIALEFLKENFYNNAYIIDKPLISSKMINIVNYGSFLFSAKNRDIQSSLLSFKKIVEVSKKQFGYFNFYFDQTTDFTKDYKNQNENKVYNVTTSAHLDVLRERVFKEYDFNEINTVEKEIKFVSVYFLIGQIIDPFVVKEKIDAVRSDDIIKIFDNYFTTPAWGIYSSSQTEKNISKDFFYR